MREEKFNVVNFALRETRKKILGLEFRNANLIIWLVIAVYTFEFFTGRTLAGDVIGKV